MKKKLFAIFDVDGTLYDNTPHGFAKINRNLSEVGLTPLSPDVLRQHWGMKAVDLFNLICDEAGATPAQRQLFMDNDYPLSKEAHYELCSELIETIKLLKDFNIFVGILTSRTAKSLNFLAEETGLDLKIFDYIQTATHYPYHKPSGRVFGPAINWAQTKKLTPDNIIYFGDTVAYDYAATLDSDPPLDFVGIVSGVSTYEEFIAAGLTTCRLTTFEKFPSFLHRYIKDLVEA